MEDYFRAISTNLVWLPYHSLLATMIQADDCSVFAAISGYLAGGSAGLETVIQSGKIEGGRWWSAIEPGVWIVPGTPASADL